MKILLVGPKKAFENNELQAQAEKQGHSLVNASINDFVFRITRNRFKIFLNQKDIAEDFNICLIRGIAPHFSRAKICAKYLYSKGIQVIDKELYSKVYEFNKLFMSYQLAEKGVPTINTYYFDSLEDMDDFEEEIDYPIIIKDVRGMHGRNVYSFSKVKDLKKFFSKKENDISKYILQKELQAEYYYRIVVIGNKAIGAMQRNTLKTIKEKKTKIEERSKPGKLSQKNLDIAVAAAKATNTDIAGVDLIFDENNQPRIMEVNRTPKFERFTQVMNVNVAEQIIKYLERYKTK